MASSMTGPSNSPASAPAVAETEVVAKGVRRRYSAEYKLRILQEADECSNGELGALLRREGLYSSHLTTWRRQRAAGQREGTQLTPVIAINHFWFSWRPSNQRPGITGPEIASRPSLPDT